MLHHRTTRSESNLNGEWIKRERATVPFAVKFLTWMDPPKDIMIKQCLGEKLINLTAHLFIDPVMEAPKEIATKTNQHMEERDHVMI